MSYHRPPPNGWHALIAVLVAVAFVIFMVLAQGCATVSPVMAQPSACTDTINPEEFFVDESDVSPWSIIGMTDPSGGFCFCLMIRDVPIPDGINRVLVFVRTSPTIIVISYAYICNGDLVIYLLDPNTGVYTRGEDALDPEVKHMMRNLLVGSAAETI